MKIIVVTLFMVGTVALASAQVFGRGPQAPRGHAHMNGQEQGQRQGQGQVCTNINQKFQIKLIQISIIKFEKKNKK